MARPAKTYRAARKRLARDNQLVWREISRQQVASRQKAQHEITDEMLEARMSPRMATKTG